MACPFPLIPPPISDSLFCRIQKKNTVGCWTWGLNGSLAVMRGRQVGKCRHETQSANKHHAQVCVDKINQHQVPRTGVREKNISMGTRNRESSYFYGTEYSW